VTMSGNEINLVFAFQTINNNSRKRKNDGEMLEFPREPKAGAFISTKPVN
jgi:hypothetical protein